MKVEIKVPPVGESILEATIGNILKPSGSIVRAEEEILELETDKVNQAVYAPAAGKLELTIKTGDVVKVGQVIGSIDSSETTATPSPPKPESSEAPTLPPAPQKVEAPKPAAPSSPKVESSQAPTLPPAPQKMKASKPAAPSKPESSSAPAPHKAAAPTPVASSSPKVESSQAPTPPPAPQKVEASTPEPFKTSSGRETRTKMTKLRRIIAEKLVEVKNQTAMLTTFNELDMSAVIGVRTKEQENFQKKYGVKLGFMSFFIKATVAALQAYPDINARIEGDEIVYHNYINIGVAVSTEKGLMVPVLRNVDTLSYAEIERKLKEFAEQARTGSLSVDALQGGTFTLTNGGTFGSLLSTPILNPPQSGILGMHAIVKRPIAVNDQVVIRPMMYLALSYDHRIVDGKGAISFLMHIKNNLEEPARLLLDL